VQLILYLKTHIPTDFETYDENANEVLQRSQQMPYIYDIAHTVHDSKFIRFSWLAIRKTEVNEFIEKLKGGDVVLYHKNNSIIGHLIRFFTRCYWEHTAMYVGDGNLIEASPGGLKKLKIEPWIVDNNVTLGILRPDIEISKKTLVESEKYIGCGYAYYKVMKHWWQIVTGSTGLGFIRPITIFLNLAQFGLALSFAISFPNHTRVQVLTVLLTGPYMFDSIHHKVAYSKKMDFF
jgi:hypothetical protein